MKCWLVPLLVLLAVALAIVWALPGISRPLSMVAKGQEDLYQPGSPERIEFAYTVKRSVRELANPKELVSSNPGLFWLGLLLVVAGVAAYWERLGAASDRDGRRHTWALSLAAIPLVLGLVWFPINLYAGFALLAEFDLRNPLLFADSAGKAYGSIVAGLLASLLLGIAGVAGYFSAQTRRGLRRTLVGLLAGVIAVSALARAPSEGGNRLSLESPLESPEKPRPASSAAPAKPIHVSGSVVAPVPVHTPQAEYTEDALDAGIEGVVIAQLTIDVAGEVENVKVLKGLPLGLEGSAESALREWRFEPATLDGEPVAVYFAVTMRFELEEQVM